MTPPGKAQGRPVKPAKTLARAMKNPEAMIAPLLGRYLAVLANAMAANGALIKAQGGNVEALHQLRVAMRRARAMVKHLGSYLPPVFVRICRRELRWASRQSSLARDLDVHLADLDKTAGDAPAALRQRLVQQRQAAYRRLLRMLTAKRFANLCARLGTTGGGQRAGVPLHVAATRALAKAHRRMIRRGRAITPESPDAAVHDVRKRAKELRYGLEFFAPLFDPGTMEAQLGQLRALQEVLGAFQDCCVQRAALQDFAARLGEKPDAAPEALRAIECLIAQRTIQATRLRRGFQTVFKRYDGKKNTKNFNLMLRSIEDFSQEA
ncbi:MAG: CHAD domain-containing protein [Pseudomonadota bacterium]